MKKILVTGGAGYIGSHTLVELYQNGFTPIIIDNLSNSSRQNITGAEMNKNTEIAIVTKKATKKNIEYLRNETK